ncbi:hypothetical protein CC2G_000315 [Coprinopsis cinerea AmutBmut pab1-1]|nr:hypothetical protein CC2G_000315 [Coprinopsis cinerea AmutBmut pab1-1]
MRLTMSSLDERGSQGGSELYLVTQSPFIPPTTILSLDKGFTLSKWVALVSAPHLGREYGFSYCGLTRDLAGQR